MKSVSSSLVLSAPLKKVWAYVCDFSHASRQMIAVKKTKLKGKKRLVTFKNGHEVLETLLSKVENSSLRWAQEGKKGFVPIKNVEVEIKLNAKGKDRTSVFFTFYYKTKMGPIGWMMNFLMIHKKLTKIAEQNLKHIKRRFNGD